MPRRKYPAELWERCKALYVSGVSIRQIATQCGIPPGTVAARAVRENWNRQRLSLVETKARMIPPEQRADEIAKVVSEARLATREPDFQLKLPDQLPRPARHVLPPDGEQDHPPPAE